MKPKNSNRLVFPATILALLTLQAANATSTYWTGLGGDANWSTAGNWNASPVPGIGDTATFDNAGNGQTAITVGSVSLSQVLFDTASAAAYTLGSGTITFADGNTTAVSRTSTVTANETINANLTLGTAIASNTTIQNASSTGLLTIGGNITGGTGGTAAAKTLTIAGAGNTTLGGAITNGGASSLAMTKTDAGTLTLTGTGSSIGGLTTVSGGTLNMSNGTLTSGGLTLNGGSSTISGSSTVWTNTGATADLTVANLLVGTTTGGNTLMISGGAVVKPTQDRYLAIGGSATSDANIVTVTGAGSVLGATGNVPGLYLGRAASNNTGGDNNEVRVLAGGSLTTGASNSRRSIIGTNSTGNKVTVDGSGSVWNINTANLFIAAGTNDSTNGVLVSNGGVVNMTGQQYVNIGNAATASANYINVTGAGSVWNMNTAQLNIGNAGNSGTFGLAGTQTGINNTLTISSGAVVSNLNWLMVGNSSAASTGNSALVQSGGLLEINTAIAVGHVSNTSAINNTLTVNTGGILQLKTAAPTITIGAGSGNAITVDGGTLSYKTVTGADMSANQTAGVGVGKFTWSGLNTFRLDGTAGNTTDTGATAYTFANNLGAKNYKTLELLGTTGITRAITLDGGNGGSLLLRGATATVTGGIALTGTVGISASSTASSLTGVISGAGGLNKLASEMLTLVSASTFSGATTISAGTLNLGNSLALQNSALDTTGSITGDASNGLKVGVTTVTLGGLTGNKNLASVFTTSTGGYSGVTALTLNPGVGATHSYAGDIANGASGMTLTKTGDGKQIFTGTNTYTGASTVSAGTLLLNGANTGGGLISVASAATLGGTGSTTAPINVTGVLSPGASIESFASGALTMNSGSTFAYEAANATATGADLMVVNGTLSLTGVTLDLSAANLGLGTWLAGDKLTLISYTGTAITSGFTGFTDDTTYTGGVFGTNQWIFNYDDMVAGANYNGEATGSSFVTFTVVPEPDVAMLVGGLGMIALLRRRRA